MNPIRQKITTLLSSDFGKNFTRVFSGNLLGGAIYTLSIPITANLYPVAAFGAFQLLLSISASVSSSSMFRFEKLIILSKTDEERNAAITLCLTSLAFTVTVVSLILFLFGTDLFGFLEATQVAEYWPLSVICLFLEGCILITSEFTLREKMFRQYSVYRALSLSLFGILPIAFSLVSTSFAALFISRLCGYFICISYLLYTNKLPLKIHWSGLDRMKDMAKANYKFPLYNMPGTLLNTLSLNIPVFLLSKYFGDVAVGIYSMATRIVQMPLSIISSAMTNVYFRTAVDKSAPGQLQKFFITSLKKLSLVGLLPTVFLPFAPYLATLFLGKEWELTGVYLQILYPVIFMSFLASPLGGTYIIISRQEYVFWLAVLAVVIRYLSIYAFSDSTATAALLSYSLVSFSYYLLYLFTLYRLIKAR